MLPLQRAGMSHLQKQPSQYLSRYWGKRPHTSKPYLQKTGVVLWEDPWPELPEPPVRAPTFGSALGIPSGQVYLTRRYDGIEETSPNQGPI